MLVCHYKLCFLPCHFGFHSLYELYEFGFTFCLGFGINHNDKCRIAIVAGTQARISVKYMVIYRHKDKYSISEMCNSFEVLRSGYYGYVARMDLPAKDLPLAEKKSENVKTSVVIPTDIVECIYSLKGRAYNITPSMSRKGNPYDNALAENFFSILKTECIYRIKLKTFDEAHLIIDEYIHLYNHERIQLKTKLTPPEKRCQYIA